jgi:2-methylcitrate dehydratase PrpD
MGLSIEKLAQFVAETQWEDIPAPVRRHAKLVFLDTLGVILAGSVRPEVQRLRERLAPTAGRGSTVFARGWPVHEPRTAALLNGIAGRAIELCEGTRLITGQPAMQTLPGILAVGEQTNNSGRELLTALIVGYEVAGRLSTAFRPRPLAHQNGQVGLLAAAAAGARMRGMDAAGVSLTMRIATTLVLTPSYTNAVAGATALNVAGGMSGVACTLAPELALAGFEAQADAVEEALANLVGDGFNPETLLEELGARWEITRNYFRLYACCNPVHPALECLQQVLKELCPQPEDIERIDVMTYRFASVMRNPAPHNYFASKYSFPHAAAVMAVRGNAGYRAIDDSALQDPRIAALRQRVHMAEDPAMSAVAPRLRPARVTVTLKDGRKGTYAVESHRGDFHQPFEETELREKFHDLASEVLRPEGIAHIEGMVDRCEKWANIGELSSQLRRCGLPQKE